MKKILFAIMASLLLISCKNDKEMILTKRSWGQTEGKDVSLYKLENRNGMSVEITNYGGVVVSISVPDKNNKIDNVALGFDNLGSYVAENPYFGALIGRYGNRIAKGKFSLNGTQYTLAVNNGVNHLHGGPKGFHKRVWEVEDEFSGNDSVEITLSYLSKDMEEGYPGNLKVKVRYSLNNNNELFINYEAETDKPTIVNLTNHSYFNLTGCKENILAHELMLYADSITPTDSTLIPTGKITALAGTGFDFVQAHSIGERIMEIPGGYDVNYKLRKQNDEFSKAAEVYETKSGRLLEVYTTEPGIQFYSGNFLDGSIIGSKGVTYEKYFGFCLEAQHFPDAPNQSGFPNVILNPGEKYSQMTKYKFSIR